MGPLRSCDADASHLTGCTVVPMDQWPEQEPARAGTVSGGQKGWVNLELLLTKKSRSPPKFCVAALEGLWKRSPYMGTCTIYRQVGCCRGGKGTGARSWWVGRRNKKLTRALFPVPGRLSQESGPDQQDPSPGGPARVSQMMPKEKGGKAMGSFPRGQ